MTILEYSGELKLKIKNENQTVIIDTLYLYDLNAIPISDDYIIELLEAKKVELEVNRKLIEFWLNKIDHENQILKDIPILYCKDPKIKNSEKLVFSFQYDVKPEDKLIWWMFDYCLKNFTIEDYMHLPYKMKLIDQGEIIAYVSREPENKYGKNIKGEMINYDKSSKIKYKAGDGVIFSKEKKEFSATKSGYLVVKDGVINIVDPFYISEDNLQLYYKNFPRFEKKFLSLKNFSLYLTKKKISKDLLIRDIKSLTIDDFKNIILIQGKEPEKSFDGQILKKLEIKKSIGTLNEKGQIDYKEIHKFRSVSENDVLVIKKISQKGANGYDIFGRELPSRKPHDIVLNKGANTYQKVEDNILSIHSKINGILEIKDKIISVSPLITIRDNIDYSTGNVRTKAHVEIYGNILNGFEVISDKSILIKGKVENNCIINAKEDIFISEGVIGEKTKIFAGGNVCVKFVENAKIYSKKNIIVEKFIMGAILEGLNNIEILGNSINQEKRGVVIDSTIKVRKKLQVTELGNDVGKKNFVYFGFDETLEKKLKKIERNIELLNNEKLKIHNNFNFNIFDPQIRQKMKYFSYKKKNKVLKSLKKYQEIEKKKLILQKMYKKELIKKRYFENHSYVEITNKIFPPLILSIAGVKHIIKEIMFKKRFIYNENNLTIEEYNNSN